MIDYAIQDDEEVIYQLLCLLESKKLNRKHFNNVFSCGIENEDVYFIVYKENNLIVGFMSLYFQGYLHHDRDTAEIVEAIVHPDYRSRGIGHKMLEEAQSIAQMKEVEEIALSSSFKRKEAHKFYEREGFLKDHYYFTKKLKI